MITEKAKKNADACRFCWMCRHLCPIGINTGNESHTPRAKGLMMSLVERGAPYTQEMAEVMYECCLCNACANDCATGYEPSEFIREARTLAVVNDLVPERVQRVIDSTIHEDNIFGMPHKDRFAPLKEHIQGLPEKAETVLYIGGTAAYKKPEIAIALIRILKKAGIDFTVIANESQSGAELGDLIGFVEEVRQVAYKTADSINATDAKNLVVLDPHDARMFKHEYSKWGCAPAMEIFTATYFVAGLIRTKKLVPQKVENITVTYQDPCRLARDIGETSPAREIMEAMGLNIKEMFLHGDMTKCCGSQLVNEHSPRLARLAAKNRCDDAARTGASILVTSCPGCLDMLGKEALESFEVADLFYLLEKQC
ncbi:MAG: (Fe-S)-binding protein [Clostridia bacterium]